MSTTTQILEITTSGSARQWGQIERINFPTHHSTVVSPSFSIYRAYFKAEGSLPNNILYPLLVYKKAFDARDPIKDGALLLSSNGWKEPWQGSVYPWQHYHTLSWEGLLCVSGNATIQFGGDSGPHVDVGLGDIVLIPPGVAHKGISESRDLIFLGTYPISSPVVDEIRDAPTPKLLQNITSCPLPSSDPFYGSSAPWGSINNLF